MDKYYIPIHQHDHFSLQDSIAQPEQVIQRCKEIGANACGISNHGNLAGCIQHIKECKKENIKPLLGIEAYICDKHSSIKDNTNRDLSHLLIYANNDNGWKNLLKMMAESSHPDNYYYKCRISLEQLSKYEDLSIINGHLGSSIGDALYNDDYETAKKIAKYCKNIWGENFWLEAQSITTKCLPQTIKILTFIRKLGKELGIKCLATADSHYVWKWQAPLQRVVLAKNLGGITLNELENSGMSTFAKFSDFFIPDYQQMLDYGSTEQELENTIVFADRISEYKNILRSPMLPNFKCPENHTANTWLRELCRNGWRNKIQNVVPKNEQQIYVDRIKHELQVFEEANLAGYFLIVEDIIRYAIEQLKCIKSPGRGSGASCLTAYLLGITQVDPLKYNLVFSRFYDESRKNTLPDLDLDFPKYKREQIIQYIKNKYGKDHVAQIATYQTMKGRAALKDVFRAYGNISVDEQNRLTKHLPDPAKIAGELQEMEEEEGESSLIRYTLENDKQGKLREWCYIDEDGTLKGPLAKQFEQAIQLEGTKVAQSKHAAGIIISPSPLNEICPLTYDTKTKSQICSLSLEDADSCGLMKMDCLGIITLDKIEDMIETAKNNEAC